MRNCPQSLSDTLYLRSTSHSSSSSNPELQTADTSPHPTKAVLVPCIGARLMMYAVEGDLVGMPFTWGVGGVAPEGGQGLSTAPSPFCTPSSLGPLLPFSSFRR